MFVPINKATFVYIFFFCYFSYEILEHLEDADDDGDGIEDDDEDHDGDGITNESKIVFNIFIFLVPWSIIGINFHFVWYR